MHMGVDDGVFASIGRYIAWGLHQCSRRGVCATVGRYRMYSSSVGSLIPASTTGCLCHRRTALPLSTSFGDDGGLKRKCWESYDNLWCLLTDEAQKGPNAEDRTPKDTKDFLPNTCGLFL
ncbi:hypothetical protein Taro_018642 [Colocasia esculenta]|uniref:Uncharacterized protein n=1 Tax=Colocasia esculenta TaxID=4460 RepID=A0A843URB0_COLES|nr:hypothetical protein [Colocasia esculenta]